MLNIKSQQTNKQTNKTVYVLSGTQNTFTFMTKISLWLPFSKISSSIKIQKFYTNDSKIKNKTVCPKEINKRLHHMLHTGRRENDGIYLEY